MASRRPVIGKWFIGLNVQPDWARMQPFVKVISVYCMKVKQYPPEGVAYRHGIDYTGVMFQMRIPFPVLIDRWR